MKRKVPRMTTDHEAEAFLARDLSNLDFSQFKPVRFEFEAKSGQLNMRLPLALLDAIKQRAAARGIPYTKFVRQVLEADLSPEKEIPSSRAGKRTSVGDDSRIGTAIGHDPTEISRLSQEVSDIRSKLQAMVDQSEDITRESRELKEMVGGLTAMVADQGKQSKQLRDRLRVLHESIRRDVARKAQDARAAGIERH